MTSMLGQETGRAEARALGALMLGGALLSASTLVLPSAPAMNQLAVGLLDAAAALAGVVLLVSGARVPRVARLVLLLAGIAVITAGAHFCGEAAGGYVPTFYVWAGLYAGWFLSSRLLAANVAVVGIAYALLLIIDPVETAIAHWLIVVGTTAAAGAMVHTLATQARTRTAEIARSGDEARTVLEQAQEGYVVVDGDDIITDWNPMAEATLGWTRDDVIGQHVDILVTGRLRRYRRAAMRKFYEDADASLLSRRVEVTARHRDGREIPVEITVSPVEFNGRRLFVTGMHDISERKAADRILDAQYQVRSVLAESTTFEDALLELLRAQGESLNWDLGAYWTLDAASGRLRRLELWSEDDVAEEFSRVAELELGSAVGQVWTTGQARWLELDRPEGDEKSGRGDVAGRAGMRSGIVLPVRTVSGPVAVAEFYSRSPKRPDREVIVVMTALNAQIAAFVERRRAEERDREHSESIAVVSRATRELSATTDPADARTAIVEAARSVAEADTAALVEPDYERNGLVRTAGGMATNRDAGAFIPFDGEAPSVTVDVFRSGEPLFIEQMRGHPRVLQSLVHQTGMHSGIFQPVRRGDRTVGVLVITWLQPVREPPERLTRIMELLADEAAVAIERTELLARLRESARSDELTGLENRRGWEELVKREMERSRREGSPLTVAMVSIESNGHGSGDRALKETAVTWRDELRGTDVLARLEGSTFATLHPSCDPDNAVHVVERLMRSTPTAACTAGVASWRESDTVADLAERASQALTLARRRGGVVLAG